MEKPTRDINQIPTQKSGAWDALKEVLIATLDHGQFSVAVLGAVAIISIKQFSQEEWAAVVKLILSGLYRGWLLGYFLSVVVAVGWWIHVKSINEDHRRELSEMENRFKTK